MSIGLVFSNVEADRLIAAAVQMERLAACEHSRQIDLLVAGRHVAHGSIILFDTRPQKPNSI